MNWKELMIVVVLMLSKSFTKAGIDADVIAASERIDSKAIQKWSELGVSLTRAHVSIDSESLIEVIKILSGAVPYVGFLLLTLVDMLHKPPNEVAEIKSQLLEMEGYLFAIENEMGAMTQQIKDTDILSYFKLQSEPIGLLQTYFRRYIQTSNTVTFTDLQQSCTQFDVLRYVYYVEKELGDSTTILPLMTTMMEGSDLANFQRWMKMLIGSISQSTMLHTVCMFAKYGNGTDLQSRMEEDVKHFQKVLKVLLNVTKEGTKHILDNFFEDAQKDVYSFALRNILSSNKKFALDLHSILEEKFFFKFWFVFSYDPVWTNENHWISATGGHVFSWFRLYNRNLQVTYTNNVVSGELNELYSKAVYQHVKKARCDYLYDSIAKSIGGTYNSIAVIQSTELTESGFYAAYHQAHAYHTQVLFKLIPNWRFRSYEVFIVPNDKQI